MTHDPVHYTIRTAGQADLDAVGAVLSASFSRLLAARYDDETLRTVLPFMVRANPGLLASKTYYVAQTGSGTLVGCGGWTKERPGSGEVLLGEAHIRHFATDPEWTGRGIGAALLARCFSDCRGLGIRTLHCYSTLNAEGFYQASGFVTIGPIDVAMTARIALPAVLLSREL